MSGFNIPITQEVIDAIRAHIPGASFVSVDLQTIRFTIQNKRKRYVFLTPRQGQIALVNFDQGRKPEPFTMRIQRPQIIDLPERKPNRDAVADRKEVRPDVIVEDERSESKKGPGRPKGSKTTKGAEIKRVSPAAKHRPFKTGGQAPPTAVLSNGKGQIREFGLKSLTR